MFPYLTPPRERKENFSILGEEVHAPWFRTVPELNETLQTEICIRILGIRTESTLTWPNPLVTGKFIHISYFTQSRTETGRRRFGTGQR